MAEEICVFAKDAIIIKSPKKSLALLRKLVLVCAMVCGIYICSVCLKQTNFDHTGTSFLNIEVNWTHCHDHSIDKSREPYLHYPKPTTFSRAECGCNPVRLFAILSMQRSGSGWFETLLNSHTNVSSNGEVFSVKERRSNVSSILSTLDRVYNLDWFTSASKNQCSAAVGFKWMLNQGVMEYHKEIVDYFNDRGVSVIFLFRRNLLRRLVSVLANSYDRYAKLLNGTHKSHVHSYVEADTLARYKPLIDSTSLVMDLKLMENTVSEALEYFIGTRHMIFYYEDLIKDRKKLVDVQEFLGVPVMELSSRQVKIHKGPLSEHIKNWEDVNKALTGTTYERFLDTD
ncbi:P-loop containing nucleoside triphosphate hydrolases superfamily protein [Perilla frutescens var. hirtella]|nr:P-loop containing nucleoside triphosphate hydrolases superfamily protein [Perilla frutescens var. hirtella]KAH6812667.1 P-loop containing nucleoside triphosphate hydrolases superfamily protein [Perilla frutescens var. frutescens]